MLLACVGVLGVGVGLLFAAADRTPPRDDRPKLVVLLSIDTMRADRVGPDARGLSATPELDKLATVSRTFTQARSPIPLTLPSHASMLTGQYPLHHGSHDNGQPVKGAPTLAERLQSAGYRTGGFISAAVLHSRFGIARGFDRYDDGWIAGGSMQGVMQRSCEEVNASAMGWLDESKESPTFLFVHYFEPHRDYVPPPPFAERFNGDPYRGEIAYADHCAGLLLGHLADLDLLHDALVIVTSDHGEGLGDHDEITHGLLAYESTQLVPLWIKLPRSAEGTVDDRFVSLVDLTPTVLAAVDLEPSEPLDGIDLLSRPSPEPRQLFAESSLAAGWGATPVAAIYEDPLKYIHGVCPELYDVRADPRETENLANSRSADADPMSQVLEDSGFIAGVRTAAGELDAQTRDMLLALGYVRDEEGAADSEQPRDAKDIAYAYYRYIGLKGTVAYQGKLPPQQRDLRLIRAVEQEAARLHKELPGVEQFAVVAADARRLLPAN